MTDTNPLAFSYGRVSTTDQASEDATSLPEQKDRTAQAIGSRGWEFGGHFEDAGVSGTLPIEERPAGAQMLAAVAVAQAEGREVYVVAMKVDRFTRSLRHGAAQLGQWADEGVGFVSVTEDFNTATPQGRMFVGILMLFADFESQTIKARHEGGRKRIVSDEAYQEENGHVWRWTGGQILYGYDVEPTTKRIIAHAEHAETVLEIFRLRASGLSTTKIAVAIHAGGHVARPRAGKVKAFTSDLVRKILTDGDAYRGHGIERIVAAGEDTTTFATPRIISEEEYGAAIAGATVVQLVRDAGTKKHTYALSQRIEHVHADGTRSGTFGLARETKGSQMMRYYRCMAARKTTHEAATCDGFGIHNHKEMTSVQAAYIEAYTLVGILTLDDADIAAITAGRLALDLAEEAAQGVTMESLEDRLADLSTQRGNLYDLAEMTGATEQIAAKLSAIAEEAEAIESRLVVMRNRRAEQNAHSAGIAEMLEATIETSRQSGEEATGFSRAQLIEDARRTLLSEPDSYGRVPFLDPISVRTLSDLVAALKVTVEVERSDDARRPHVRVFTDGVRMTWQNEIEGVA